MGFQHFNIIIQNQPKINLKNTIFIMKNTNSSCLYLIQSFSKREGSQHVGRIDHWPIVAVLWMFAHLQIEISRYIKHYSDADCGQVTLYWSQYVNILTFQRSFFGRLITIEALKKPHYN